MRALLCSALAALAAGAVADQQAFLSYPDIHGNEVVFTAEGDLWLADVNTGDAHRLTSDPGIESRARFSPDGTQIAFTASYDGAPNVYVMPVTGGTPKRLTFDPMAAQVIGWTPDGKSILYRSSSKMYSSAMEQFVTDELFTVSVLGGLPKKVAVPRASFASMNADGHTLAYVPTSNEWMNWFRYQAGEADQIWLADLSKSTFNQLTNSKGVETQPVWAGNSLYFVSERSGVRNLWMLDPASKKARQITSSSEATVRHPGSDGKRVVFELGPRLEVFDPVTNVAKVIPIHLDSDHIHERPYETLIAANPADGVGLGPTGKRVAIAVRGHLVTVPVGEGPMHSVTGDSNQRIQNPSWSPDGKQIAYVSDASGEEQLYLVDAADGSTPKQLTKGLAGEHGAPIWSPDGKFILIGNRDATIELVDATTGAVKKVMRTVGPMSYDAVMTDFVFSPDSKWVAFSMPNELGMSHISLYNIASGATTQLTDEAIESDSPAFSPDGKYLFMLQERNVGETFGMAGRISHDFTAKVTAFTLAASTPTPFLPTNDEEAEVAKKPEVPAKETKVDIDGIRDRYFDMKVPAGKYSALSAVSGRLLLQLDGTVLAFDIGSKSLIPLANGVRALEVSKDGKKLLVAGPGTLQVIDAAGGPTPPGAGTVKLAGLTVTVDPIAEWHQMFEETWRVGRDFFYDPNTHGVNWKAVKAKYEAQLPLVATRDDLTLVLKDMISEFNTGHCFVSGPSSFPPKAARPGLLGVDLGWDSVAHAYKIKHILRGETWSPENRSPLAEPGLNVHEGDYLLKVRGRTLTSNEDPDALLVGTAGLTVSISVNSKGTMDGARTLSVVPIASDMALRLQDWVAGRRAYVEKASGGQIGYVYVSDMEEQGANEFAKAYYPNVNKPGIIIDVRGNGGGNISGNLLGDLASKISGYFAFRAGGTYRRESWAPEGQVVAVTNEFAFSDGEYFSEFFKRLKIGPLVGHRTGGGEVGSGGGYRMMDGGVVYIPNYGAWVPGEWVVEGRGAVPDFEVDQDPTSVMAGKDPQLDKAIAIIMENLQKHPFKAPEHPPFPVKLGGSRGG